MPRTRILDLHCDTLDLLAWQTIPKELRAHEKSYAEMTSAFAGRVGDIACDAVHIKLDEAAGLDWVQCLAVFVLDELSPADQRRFFESVAESLPVHLEAHPDRFALCRTMDEAEAALAAGKFAGILTIEGAGLLASGDDAVELIDAAGVRMVTLTWNRPSPLGSGHDTHEGLTDLGRKRIRELEDRRIAVDVSHLNDEGFADLLGVVRRPFAASHSNSRAVCDVPRNLTDDQFRAIRDAGGVAGICYSTHFINGTDDYAPEELFAHIDHWLDLDGADAIALGSDFDGTDVPAWLAGCAQVGELAGMLEARYGEELAGRICYGNAADFLRRIERG